MLSIDDLVPVADSSAFIFTGSIVRLGASTVASVPIDAETVVVSVEVVVKAPAGMGGLPGREVTVQLSRPRPPGRYVFFANLLAVSDGIAVKELTHLEGTDGSRERAVAAMERSYAALITGRAQRAFLVALGSLGDVQHLFPPAERRGRVPWATATFEIEQVLKGNQRTRRVTLIGPGLVSKRMPQAPPLRAGLRAILFLHRPPEEAAALISSDERRLAAFIERTSDIQPPDQLETIVQIISGAE